VAMMVWCGLTTVGVGVSDIEKRCNAHHMSGNAFCIFGVRRYTCIFGYTDVIIVSDVVPGILIVNEELVLTYDL
jgi:hypothetical protein